MTDRLEQAEEGSRELDAQIANEYGGLTGMGYETWDAIEAHAPHYTTSLDAKLPWENITMMIWHAGEFMAWHENEDGSLVKSPRMKTEALARRTAALKARQAQESAA